MRDCSVVAGCGTGQYNAGQVGSQSPSNYREVPLKPQVPSPRTTPHKKSENHLTTLEKSSVFEGAELSCRTTSPVPLKSVSKHDDLLLGNLIQVRWFFCGRVLTKR